MLLDPADFALQEQPENNLMVANQINCEYSRLSSLPAPEGRFARRPSGGGSDERRLYSQATNQGPVVRKPINANPRLKVNRGFHFAR